MGDKWKFWLICASVRPRQSLTLTGSSQSQGAALLSHLSIWVLVGQTSGCAFFDFAVCWHNHHCKSWRTRFGTDPGSTFEPLHEKNIFLTRSDFDQSAHPWYLVRFIVLITDTSCPLIVNFEQTDRCVDHLLASPHWLVMHATRHMALWEIQKTAFLTQISNFCKRHRQSFKIAKLAHLE